ncbi:hypothetical protein NDN08_007845 [Rhodosorus marinus]|uniref:NAD(P)-binding protein n=1 Tax=Rhodosorus marinus TaxID=101924 RepID=A0AAV8UZ21_9RHOD|nr:hypothetical protein NDN08_007845 [Rhodosorus marinus]
MEPLLPNSDYGKTFGTVLVIGGTGGLGTAITEAFVKGGCKVFVTCRKVTPKLSELDVQVLEGVDMRDPDGPKNLVSKLGGEVFDTVMVIAGYFTTECLGNMSRDEQLKMFEICAIGPIRYVDGLYSGGSLKSGSRVGFITSEGGSMGLRTEREGGGNYGHHGSKAAQNMMCLMLSYDLKPHGVPVVMIHPGFMKTEMTADKYADKYEEFGAVFPHEAAPFIVDCVARLELETTGRFVSAMGSKGLGLGYYALKDPENMKPGCDLPW